MAVITYKCPNCDGGLIFDPESQKFHCEYCLSYFSEEELQNNAPSSEEETRSSEQTQKAPVSPDTTVIYTCPSCGAGSSNGRNDRRNLLLLLSQSGRFIRKIGW